MRTTKEEEGRQQPRQRRRQPQDIKKEEGSKDNKKEEIKRDDDNKEERRDKEEGRSEEEGRRRREEDKGRKRGGSTTKKETITANTTKMDNTTGIAMTAIISFLPFISRLPLPFSDSTEPGASSSTSIKLNSIKQSLINNIKGLLDFNIEHNNSDLFDNKQQQQDINMSMPPMMVPTSPGSTMTSVLPQHRPFMVNEDDIVRQLTHYRPQDPRQPSLPDRITNIAQLLRQVQHHLLLGQQHPSQPQRGHASAEACQRLHQQHAAITAVNRNSIRAGVLHLFDRA